MSAVEVAPAFVPGDAAALGCGDRAAAALGALGEVAPLVARHGLDADRRGRLADPVVDAARARGLFHLLRPDEAGGSGLDTDAFFTVIEAAGRLDGSFGWNLCVANMGAAAVADALSPAAVAELVDDPTFVLAGAVRPGAVSVEAVEGGCVFDGRVAFASGSAHATHFLAAAALAGGPAGTMRCGIVPRGDVDILDTWHVSGLRATASADVALRRVFVPAAWTFELALAQPVPGLLPFASRLGAGLACVALGIASHALDRLTAIATQRPRTGTTELLAEQAEVQIAVARARGLIDGGRAHLLHSYSRSEAAAARRPLSPDQLAALRLSYVAAAQQAAAATDLAWEAAGSVALYEAEGLERCWRDVHAATQHAMVSARHLARLGRISLGGPVGPGPI